MKDNRYDVLVVGGGPAGMLAAATAAKYGVKVLLLDKNKELGKKMLITGGGRCNLTNAAGMDEIIQNIPGNGKFIYSALHQFSNQDLRNFLFKIGISTKIEENGKVFPTSDKALDVVKALVKHLQELKVEIRQGVKVEQLLIQDNLCLGVLAGGKEIQSRTVVIATGGLSYPGTGSTGEGHQMARQLGHTVTKLFPAAVSIKCGDNWITNRDAQGISLPEVKITVKSNQGKTLTVETGAIIFTHWGLSGPGGLRVGRTVALHCPKGGSLIGEIDLFPGLSREELQADFLSAIQSAPRKSIKNILWSLLPQRLSMIILDLADLSSEIPVIQIHKTALEKLVELMKYLPITIVGTRPLEEATVTGGGISIKEVNPKTMASKIIKGLYFAGEIIDVDAHTGGFNMQIAFSTGYAAGGSAALYTKETLD